MSMYDLGDGSPRGEPRTVKERPTIQQLATELLDVDEKIAQALEGCEAARIRMDEANRDYTGAQRVRDNLCRQRNNIIIKSVN